MALINRATLTMNNQSDLFFNRLSSVISSTFIRSLFVIRYICKYQNTFFFSVCYNRCSGKTAFIYFAPCYCWFWQSVCCTCEINVCALQNWAVVWRSYGNCWNYYNEDIEQLCLLYFFCRNTDKCPYFLFKTFCILFPLYRNYYFLTFLYNMFFLIFIPYWDIIWDTPKLIL